jgi:hypothetical protein
MIVRPSSGHHSSPPPRPTPDGFSGKQPQVGMCEDRAVAALLRGEVLHHTFGPHGEYEVRTTQAIGQPWRYRCCVLHRGKALKHAFAPIVIDRKREMPSISRAQGIDETMRLRWARQAAEVHFTRCAALQEYLLLAAVNLQPPPWSKRYHGPIAFLFGVTLLLAYGVWRQSVPTDSVPSPEMPPSMARSVPDAGAERRPLERLTPSLPLSAPPPVIGGAVNDDVPAEPVRTPLNTRQPRPLKTIRLADLLGNQVAPQRDFQTSQASTSRDLSGTATAGVQAGDLLRVTGWIHRISRDPERAYRLDIRASREGGSPGLIAMVPHPDQAFESPAMKAQLQSVRTFIMQRLLRRQEPSLRGSVMRRPIAVQLTGQLAPLDTPQRKGPRGVATHWEVQPVLEIQFAGQSESSARAR